MTGVRGIGIVHAPGSDGYPDALAIVREIEATLISTYPRHRTYWECRTPDIMVHSGWLGSNWTWSALVERADLQRIAFAAERVRRRHPRAAG